MNKFKTKNQKGYALLAVLLILGVMSVVVLGMNMIMVTKMKIAVSAVDSVGAFYAAESGAERILYNDRKWTYDPIPAKINSEIKSGNLTNGARYSVILLNDSPTSIKSIGSFQSANRALELNYSN